jgi:hypothetical protein
MIKYKNHLKYVTYIETLTAMLPTFGYLIRLLDKAYVTLPYKMYRSVIFKNTVLTTRSFEQIVYLELQVHKAKGSLDQSTKNPRGYQLYPLSGPCCDWSMLVEFHDLLLDYQIMRRSQNFQVEVII